MALCHHTTPARTGSCPVPPWPTPALGGSQARYARVEGGVHSLLCEILIAGFWVATAAPGLLSLVSCMRSLMMACLSTEPAGTPGRLSGKSCGNWLFCRSSRISSKLSNSLPGCNKEHANPQYTSLLARCWRPARAKPGSPPPSHPHWPWMCLAPCLMWRKLTNLLEGDCAGFSGLVCLAFGESSVALAPLQKPHIRTYDSTPWATGRSFPVHSVTGADSRDNRRSRSAEDGGLCRYNQYFFQHSYVSSLFTT